MKKENKRLGALDGLIIVVIIACLVSIGLRIFSTVNAGTNSSVELDNYIVSFKVMNIKDSSAKNYFEKGTTFYFDESGEVFGTLREGITIKDAEKFYEKPDGSIVLTTNNAVGDLYRVDVEASLNVKGTMDENGGFYLDGNKFIAPNKEIKIYSKYLSITITVTGVNKA